MTDMQPVTNHLDKRRPITRSSSGADATSSAYDVIRKGGFEIASAPEPSWLFGYPATDAVIRAMAGREPAHFLQPVFLVVKDNVDTEAARTMIPAEQTTWSATTKISGRVTTRPDN
jgi:hypothetical protein